MAIAEDMQTCAPTANLARCSAAMERVLQRPAHLPGVAVLYGPSGWGKSWAASYAARKHGCHYLAMRASWNGKALLRALLWKLGLKPEWTIAQMVDSAVDHLLETRQGLVIDEFDHVVRKGAAELVRDLVDATGCGLLLVGEEGLPTVLRRWERFHGRVLEWVPADALSLDDARVLRDVYLREVEVGDDLLERLWREAKGSVRRLVVNLHLIEQEGLRQGADCFDLASWQGRALYTGEAPPRRAAA